MNKVELVGRLTADPNPTTTGNGNTVCKFTIAVNRNFKNAEGNYDADFIRCTCFSKKAEALGKFFHKGDPIGIDGRIQTGSYKNQEGNTVYTTDVIVDNWEFIVGRGKASSSDTESENAATAAADATFSQGSISEEELPF